MTGGGQVPRLGAHRALDMALRTAHLGAMAVLLGGAWYGAAAADLRPALWAAVGTGAALLLVEASQSRHWIYQGRGLLALAHLAAAGLASALGTRALVAALVLGAVGSHLPKSLRKWSVRHGAVLD